MSATGARLRLVSVSKRFVRAEQGGPRWTT